MKITRTARISAGMIAICLVGTVMAVTSAQADNTPAPAWSYAGVTGPNEWGSLSSQYAACADGSAQSPINITKTKNASLRNLEFDYRRGEAEVFNNGHTVEVEPSPGEDNTVRIGSVTYPFTQFHFHAPSEHEVNGKRYPLEIHFVHKTASGQISVVGVFVKEGKRNAEWAKVVNVIPIATADPKATTIEDLDWSKLLPTDQQTIRYNGSLTTPPCSESVKWNVMSTPIEMSKNQIAAFRAQYSDNARPVQPLDGRVPLLDVSAK
jgi:carbonic anhydrase